MGYFKFGGSTILMLFEENKVKFHPTIVQNTKLGYETYVRSGITIGRTEAPVYYQKNSTVSVRMTIERPINSRDASNRKKKKKNSAKKKRQYCGIKV